MHEIALQQNNWHLAPFFIELKYNRIESQSLLYLENVFVFAGAHAKNQ